MSGLPYEGWLVNKLYRPAGILKVKSLPHGTIVMPTKNPAAVALGRLGGQVKSKRKAAAARLNGQKGGWPKGKKRKGKRQ